jgi:hypothetical protein
VKKVYCTQEGNCQECSLSNYNKDCKNNKISKDLELIAKRLSNHECIYENDLKDLDINQLIYLISDLDTQYEIIAGYDNQNKRLVAF